MFLCVNCFFTSIKGLRGGAVKHRPHISWILRVGAIFFHLIWFSIHEKDVSVEIFAYVTANSIDAEVHNIARG